MKPIKLIFWICCPITIPASIFSWLTYFGKKDFRWCMNLWGADGE